MEKQKNTHLVLLVLFSVLFITNIVLVCTKIYKWWLFVILFVVLSIFILVSAIMLAKVLKKIREIKTEQKQTQSVGDYNLDLYAILGIPVQYNKDGSVKNIYDLLGIEPIYDENGNRILTIYELLGFMPRFNSNGEEIPSVLSIKNRVGKIAKVDVSSRVLTRKLTEEEKEQIAIREFLTRKLKEAEQTGDSQKQEAIKNVLKTSAPAKSKGKASEYSPPKYKLGKAAKPVGSVKLGKNVGPNNEALLALFAFFTSAGQTSADKESKKSDAIEINKEEGNKSQTGSVVKEGSSPEKSRDESQNSANTDDLTCIIVNIEEERSL